MLQLIPLLWRRLEFASVACISLSFWALAVLVHVKLQGGVIEPLVLGTMLLCCMLLLGFVSLRRWKSLGTPGLLLLAAIASYLFISSVAPLATDSELSTKDVARQGFFFVVTLAAILGGRWLLERIGVETLLKWTLVILAASCAVILASPLLREIGALPAYWHPYRMTGAFTDPNDAGFIACMTAALALAFQSNGRQRHLGYLALVLGCAAALASFSRTAVIVLGVILILFLLVNVRRLRQDLWHTGLTVLCLAVALTWLILNIQGILSYPQPETPTATSPASVAVGVVDADEANWVRDGDTILVCLVGDKSHRADDNPVNPWRWQRADARPGDVDTPDDATWTNIEGALLSNYTLEDEDVGKFLRAYVSYEKNGMTRRAQTQAIGPIMAASAETATDANALSNRMKESLGLRDRPEAGEITCESSGRGGLSRRMLLWEMGFNKVLESPIVGHGLYQLHYMEDAPLGNEGIPTGVHNVYLMLLGEAGIIPLALYLLSLFFLMRLLWTAPKSLGRDLVVGWVIVMALFGLMFHHLLTMGAYNFVIGLACATAAFLVQRQQDPTAA